MSPDQITLQHSPRLAKGLGVAGGEIQSCQDGPCAPADHATTSWCCRLSVKPALVRCVPRNVLTADAARRRPGDMLMRRAFWVACFAILYTYVLYPALVVLRGRLRHRPYKTGDATPTVTLVLAARNEELSLPLKLDNIAELEYPRERLQVIVASDGSTDQSEQIVAEHHGTDARFLALPRMGKSAILNVATGNAQGEIVVFSDANSIYRKDALMQLVRPFVDPDIGGVAGNQVYHRPSGPEGVIAGERRYSGPRSGAQT